MKKSILFFLFANVAKIKDYSKKQTSLLKSIAMLCTATLLFSCTAANDEPFSVKDSLLNQIKTNFNPNTFTDFEGGKNWSIDWNNYNELTKDSTQVYTFAIKQKYETKVFSDLFQEKVFYQIIGFKNRQKTSTYLLEVKSCHQSPIYTNDITHLENFNGIATVYTFDKQIVGTITFNAGKAFNNSLNNELKELVEIFNRYYIPKLNNKIPTCTVRVMIYDLSYVDKYEIWSTVDGKVIVVKYIGEKLISTNKTTVNIPYPCDSPSNTDEKYVVHRTPTYINRVIEKIDSSGLTGKAKCLNDLLTKNGNLFVQKLLANFQGNSTFDINIVSADKVFDDETKAEVNGNTKYDQNVSLKQITIQISTSRSNDQTALDAARTILHEYVHADIVRKLYTPEQIKSGAPSFKTVFDAYGSAHGTMAGLYLNSMKDALKDFHKNALTEDYNKYVAYWGHEPTDAFYEAMAWGGLQESKVKDWVDLPDEKKKEINALASKENAYLTKNAPCP